jgi:hypothetical protein
MNAAALEIEILGRVGQVRRWEYAPGLQYVFVVRLWAVLFRCAAFSYPAANDPE